MEELREKLTHLLKTNSITQNELAEKIGVSRQVISTLCKGKVKNSKALYPISKFFNVEYTWLVNEAVMSTTASNQEDMLVLGKFHKIPLLNTRLLNKNLLIDGKLNVTGASEDFELTTSSEYKQLFALKSTNNSLKCRFNDHTTLVFHTQLTPSSGDFVIVYLPQKDIFVYRDLEIINGKSILKPIDIDIYKPIVLKKEYIIVAVLYEKRILRGQMPTNDLV